jgi:hypothetical protein
MLRDRDIDTVDTSESDVYVNSSFPLDNDRVVDGKVETLSAQGLSGFRRKSQTDISSLR